MKTNTPEDLFFDQLHDIHSFESQLLVSLPTLIPRISFPPLKARIFSHLEETRHHWEIVTGILRVNGVEPRQDTCLAMEGLIKGGDAHLEEVEVPTTRDLMVVAHCLRIEHYEIAAYTITSDLAKRLQRYTEAEELEAVLTQERNAASGLKLVEAEIFRQASLISLP